MNSTEAAHKL